MEAWIQAFASLLRPISLLWFMFGTVIGIIFGALPGIGVSLTLTLLLPFTFNLPPTVGLPLLIAAWQAAIVGGSISAITINTPGTGGNVATCFDGFPLAEQGKGKLAIGISTVSSMIGGLGGVIVLYIGLQLFSRIILLFGPPEMFLLSIFGLCLLSVTARGAALKGLIGAGVGLLASLVGYDIISGYSRFTWGTDYLYDGMPFLTIVIGLFAVARMLELVTTKEQISATKKLTGSIFEGMLVPFRYVKTILRSIGIASVFGFAPGLGTTASSLISYSMAKQGSKDPEEFGKGAYEGVVAPEVANNAVSGGALIPGLSLGIPGNTDTAVFMVGLMMYGIRPGRELLTTNSHLVYLMLAAMVLAQFAYFLVMVGSAKALGRITTVPIGVMAPIVLVIALTGAYAVKGNIWDVVVAIVFGVIGYALLKLKYPVVPFLMSVVLARTIEGNFGRALMISEGSYAVFFKSPLSKALIVLLVFSFFYPYLSDLLRKRRLARTASSRNPTGGR